MYNEWSLDIFYHGADDPALATDMEKLESLIARYNEAAEALTYEDTVGSLTRVLEVEEEVTVTVSRIAGYFSLRRSANSGDVEGAKYLTKIQTLTASTTKASALLRKFVGGIEDLDAITEASSYLKEYAFLLRRWKDAASHQLSDEAEVVFARMNLSGGRAWGDLVSHLTATVEVDYKGGKTSLSAIRGLADSDERPRRSIR